MTFSRKKLIPDTIYEHVLAPTTKRAQDHGKDRLDVRDSQKKKIKIRPPLINTARRRPRSLTFYGRYCNIVTVSPNARYTYDGNRRRSKGRRGNRKNAVNANGAQNIHVQHILCISTIITRWHRVIQIYLAIAITFFLLQMLSTFFFLIIIIVQRNEKIVFKYFFLCLEHKF